MAIIPAVYDVEIAVEETRRAHEAGLRGILIPAIWRNCITTAGQMLITLIARLSTKRMMVRLVWVYNLAIPKLK